MDCLICNSNCTFFFSKEYKEYPFNEFMKEIGVVDYFKCCNCGFVLSKTHLDLEPEKWNRLNSQFHHFIENPDNEKKGNQPPNAEQAMMIKMLSTNQIIKIDSMVDFAAGYGTLGRILLKYFDISLPIFDPFVQDLGSSSYLKKSELGSFKTVINSAFFEHILRRSDLDQLNDLVDPDGCLIIHTVVCETIPKDENWFYLRPPVHTAFHTNKSMEILMKQWGYVASIYCPRSKSWVLLKEFNSNTEKRLESLNRELQTDWFVFKRGFMDYWK